MCGGSSCNCSSNTIGVSVVCGHCRVAVRKLITVAIDDMYIIYDGVNSGK